MYNYSLNLTYRDNNDTVYRKEILETFNLKEYSNKINEEIDNLYEIHKNYYIDIIKSIQEYHPMALASLAFGKMKDKECFMVLFSWDYFYENHQYLHSIINNLDDILVRKNTLIDKIISNKK
jgi:hypothetical protein